MGTHKVKMQNVEFTFFSIYSIHFHFFFISLFQPSWPFTMMMIIGKRSQQELVRTGIIIEKRKWKSAGKRSDVGFEQSTESVLYYKSSNQPITSETNLSTSCNNYNSLIHNQIIHFVSFRLCLSCSHVHMGIVCFAIIVHWRHNVQRQIPAFKNIQETPTEKRLAAV